MRLEFPDKLKALLKEKVRQKEEAMHIEDTQRLFAEIEMLKVVLYLVASREGEEEKEKEKEKTEPSQENEEQMKKVTGLHNKVN